MQNHILNSLPDEYRPLSPWAYFLYGLLFIVPLVGFVFLIIFSFNKRNINRRNYARSYFCGLILAILILAALIALIATGVLTGTIVETIKEAAEPVSQLV